MESQNPDGYKKQVDDKGGHSIEKEQSKLAPDYSALLILSTIIPAISLKLSFIKK